MSSKFLENILVGKNPIAVSDDGTYTWVANKNSNTVTQIQNSDPTIINTIIVGNEPTGIFSNGTYCFVANLSSSSITQINITDLTTINISLLFTPVAICVDSNYIWVSHLNDPLVTRILISDTSQKDDVTVGDTPVFIAVDADFCWVANYDSNTVSHIDLTNITSVDTIIVGSNPISLSSDNNSCWVANSGSANVTRILASDISQITTINVGPSPSSICSDSLYCWVANQGNDTVSRILITDTNIVTVLTAIDYGFDGVSALITNNNIENITALYLWVCNTTSNLLNNGFVTQILQYSPPPPSTNTHIYYNLDIQQNPISCSSDHTYCWIANFDSSSISQLSLATHIFTTINLDFQPLCVFSDGTFVWIVDSNNSMVHQLVIEPTPTSTPTINSINVGFLPSSVCSDGIYAWCANGGEDVQTVSRILISDITQVHTFNGGGVNPTAISSDGTYCWTANGDNTASRILISDITQIDSIPVGQNPQSISTDGLYTWVANFNDNTITQIDASNISNVYTISVGITPKSISSDGKYVWVANIDANFNSRCDIYQIVIEPVPTNTPTMYWLSAISYGFILISSLMSDGEFLWVTNTGNINNTPNGFISQLIIENIPPPPIGNICFPLGTPITTDQGQFAIESIDPTKVTINQREIIAITQSIGLPEDYLVCFKRGSLYSASLAYSVPNADTTMSPAHKVLYKGRLIEAREFIGHFPNVIRVPYVRGTTLYNVLMKQYDIMWINGMVVETLHPDNIIARLYVSDNAPELKMKLIACMNDCIVKRLPHSYKRVIQRIVDC
jgi:hypothetical protein